MIFTGRPPWRGLVNRSTKLGAIAVALLLVWGALYLV